ncbi:MAG: ATP synthase F1 subunit gamma [Campylobacterales bacterium]
MPSLKEIKRKIKSVKNTQKTTKAMKLVSTSKLKKAEELAKSSRVYADKITQVLSDICFKVEKFRIGGIENKFFACEQDSDKAPKMVDIVFITADKGLCGGFNHQTIKRVTKLIEQYKKQDVKVRLRGIGKKGISFFNFNNIELLDSAVDISAHPDYKKSADFIESAVEDYVKGTTDRVILVYNGYKNMITQELKEKILLPIDTSMCKLDTSMSLMEVEPTDEEEEVLDSLAKKYVEYSMYYGLIDSLAAEHSARMQAMDAATNNAKELADSLTVDYNKARQEAITKELIEINTGMEALK